jgi:hypothetical protein
MSDHDYHDVEPEDAWDRNDAPEDQLRNLARRLLALDPDAPADVSLDELVDIAQSALLVRGISDRQRLRGEQILEDVRIVRGRL